MKILTTKWFKKWSAKAKLNREGLLAAIKNLENGLSSSNLGDDLFKIRVKREHSGKSSGFRTIVAYKKGDTAVFLYGFGKNERDNINNVELRYFKKLGNDLLALNELQLQQFIAQEILFNLKVTR